MPVRRYREQAALAEVLARRQLTQMEVTGSLTPEAEEAALARLDLVHSREVMGVQEL